MLRFPDLIQRHGSALIRAGLGDPRLEALVEAAEDGAVLEKAALTTILAEQGFPIPAPGDYAEMPFGFLRDDLPEHDARRELEQAAALLIERPALEVALANATARFESELSDGAYAEQQRLLKRKLEFDTRLRQMAGQRASGQPDQAPQPTAE